MTVDIILSSTTWTCPSNVLSVQAECLGAGGGAGGSGGGAFGRPGGGGGAYSLKSSIGVTPTTGYTATVGTGGALNTNGGDTSFVGDSSNTCLAKGGSCGVAASGAGGAGGVAASGTGDTKYSGGAGGTSTGAGGAGGGSSAGTGSAGANGTGASSATGGAGGTAPTGGGNGGRGGDDPFNGGKTDGTVPGGGGGGASLTFGNAGASGAAGKIILTYTAVPAGVGSATFAATVAASSQADKVATGTASGTFTSTGSALFSPSRYSLNFNGVAGALSQTPYAVGGTGSVSAWFKPTGTDLSGNSCVLRVQLDSPLRILDLVVYSGTIYAGWYNNGTDNRLTVTASTYLNLDKWNHVLLTWSPSGTTLYVNGSSVASSGTAPATWDTSTATTFQWGGTSGIYSNGLMDEVAVWSANQSAYASGLYAGTTRPLSLPTSLTSFLPMEEGTGTSTADITGGHTATFLGGEGAVVWGEDVPGNLGPFPGTATFSTTATAGSQVDATGTGASTYSFAAEAASQADAVAAGTASTDFTAAADSQADVEGTGSATYSFTGEGTGTADFTGTGGASVTLTAVGSGLADALSEGTAEYSFTAAGTGGTVPPAPEDAYAPPHPSLMPVLIDTHDRHKLAVLERQRRIRRRRRAEEDLAGLGDL